MTIQLTPEQENRVKAIVSTGLFPSPEDALNAALTAVEISAFSFEGSKEGLETLLAEGLKSREITEEEFWDSVNRETDAMFQTHKGNTKA